MVSFEAVRGTGMGAAHSLENFLLLALVDRALVVVWKGIH